MSHVSGMFRKFARIPRRWSIERSSGSRGSPKAVVSWPTGTTLERHRFRRKKVSSADGFDGCLLDADVRNTSTAAASSGDGTRRLPHPDHGAGECLFSVKYGLTHRANSAAMPEQARGAERHDCLAICCFHRHSSTSLPPCVFAHLRRTCSQFPAQQST